MVNNKISIPASLPAGYYGPLAMPSVQIRYSGFNAPGITCPPNYPAAAPQSICGHVSFVELDGQMAYKMALAYHATGDSRSAEAHEHNVFFCVLPNNLYSFSCVFLRIFTVSELHHTCHLQWHTWVST